MWGILSRCNDSLFKEKADGEFNIQARGCWNSAVRKAFAALERLEGI
jgi:hypothetical protein